MRKSYLLAVVPFALLLLGATFSSSAPSTGAVNAHNGVYNVLDYGVKCDGTTDDGPAFRTLAGTTAPPGATIRIPNTGHPCVINSGSGSIGMTMQSGQYLLGCGMACPTYLQCNNALGSYCVYTGGDSQNVEIGFLQIQGSGPGVSTVQGIHTAFNSWDYFHNIYLTGLQNGMWLSYDQQDLVQAVNGNENTNGLTLVGVEISQFDNILFQNNGTGGNLVCNGCVSDIFNIPLQDETYYGNNWQILGGEDLIFNVGIFFSTACAPGPNCIPILIDTNGTSTPSHITINGAHMQQYSSGEGQPNYFVVVDAGTDIVLRDTLFDGNADISDLPDGGFSSPPLLGLVSVSSTSSVVYQNDKTQNLPDAGYLIPWFSADQFAPVPPGGLPSCAAALVGNVETVDAGAGSGYKQCVCSWVTSTGFEWCRTGAMNQTATCSGGTAMVCP
jgi:hypothetical protein